MSEQKHNNSMSPAQALAKKLSSRGHSGRRNRVLLSKNNLKAMMDEVGLTAYAVGKELGMHCASLTSWYNGETPSLASAIRLAKFFGCKVEDIWDVEE